MPDRSRIIEVKGGQPGWQSGSGAVGQSISEKDGNVRSRCPEAPETLEGR
jgi:hypothetical protein